MRKIAKRLSVLMNCCVMTVLLLTVYMQKQLPDRYSVVAGEEISFSAGYPIQMVQTSGTEEIPIEKCVGDSYQMDLKLLGTIPVKTV